MPTAKQEENTQARIAEVHALVARHYSLAEGTPPRLATEIVKAIEAPILALLYEEERSRTRMLRLIRAQDRLNEARRRNYDDATIAERSMMVERTRSICNEHGDLQTIDIEGNT